MFSEKIKFSSKFCTKKGLWSEIVYQRVYKQKLVSVACEEVADNDWSNWYCGSQTFGCKQIRPFLSCQTTAENIPSVFTQFHLYGFQM